MPKKRHPHFAVLSKLRAFGLGLPGTHTKAKRKR